MHTVNRILLLLVATVWLAGCATGFPRATTPYAAADGLDGAAVLARGVAAHGGDLRTRAGDLNYASDGRWETLIQRIQPVVTDAGYRVTAETRYSPSTGLHAIRYQGPKGVKQVVRTPGAIEVVYDGVRATDPETLQAAAMTTDAFELFHFGPTFLAARATAVTRMADADEAGGDGVLGELLGEVGELARLLPVVQLTAVHHGHTGGVVSAVFETAQALHQDVESAVLTGRGGLADVSDDSAHAACS